MIERPRSTKRLQFECKTKSLTKQSFKPQCDINAIVQKGLQGGLVTHLNGTRPQYGDFSNVPDYQAALALVSKAQTQFESLPSRVRERFSNDPALMLAFVSDKANFDEAVSLGLVEAPPQSKDPAGGVVPPKPQPAASAG